jgi:hypothetical protein
VHLLCAYCDAVPGVLGQVTVETTRENGITVAAELLKGVAVKGRVISGDAMFARKSVCQAVLDGGRRTFGHGKGQPAVPARSDRRCLCSSFSPWDE